MVKHWSGLLPTEFRPFKFSHTYQNLHSNWWSAENRFNVSLRNFGGLRMEFGARISGDGRVSKPKRGYKPCKTQTLTSRRRKTYDVSSTNQTLRNCVTSQSLPQWWRKQQTSISQNLHNLSEFAWVMQTLGGTKFGWTVWRNGLGEGFTPTFWFDVSTRIFNGLETELGAQIWWDAAVTQAKHAHQLWKPENR